MKIGSPIELLADQIRDLFSAETQISQTMPELAALSPDPALRDFLANQEELSLTHLGRLKDAASVLHADAEGDACKALKGLIEGGNKHIETAEGPLVTSLILIAHVNRIIHYQIAGYDVADALAKQLGVSDVDALLESTLAEERDALRTLAELSVKIYSMAKGSAS